VLEDIFASRAADAMRAIRLALGRFVQPFPGG
jgi:hypothetical protein